RRPSGAGSTAAWCHRRRPPGRGRPRDGGVTAAGRAAWSHLDLLAHRGDDALHGGVDVDAVVLAAVAHAEGDRAGGLVLAAGDEQVGHLLLGVGADLLLHPVIGGIDLHTHPVGA